MQIIFKAITGSSVTPSGGKELHSTEITFDGGLVALESISPRKGTYYGMLGAVHYLAKRTSQGSDQLRGFSD